MSDVRKSKQVATTIPPEYHDALENYRWNPAVKLTMTQLVKLALDEFAKAKGIKVSGEASIK